MIHQDELGQLAGGLNGFLKRDQEINHATDNPLNVVKRNQPIARKLQQEMGHNSLPSTC